jgi:hypothetical protein
MNERCQRIVIDPDYTDEELGVRDRLCAALTRPSSLSVLCFGALRGGSLKPPIATSSAKSRWPRNSLIQPGG